MSYVLLASLFIVSGISGSKVSDMATVAPALFPEMKRRGNKQSEMVALLATGAAMADTVPPSIVLIVLGSVAGVSIAGLFESGFFVAMVLLLALLVLARWKARNEVTENNKRPALKVIGKLTLIAAPALVLPFLIRSAVGGGVATATEVSTIAVLYHPPRPANGFADLPWLFLGELAPALDWPATGRKPSSGFFRERATEVHPDRQRGSSVDG
jgi:TRAP-type C4-dicarboxylate transport system permease large subunit